MLKLRNSHICNDSYEDQYLSMLKSIVFEGRAKHPTRVESGKTKNPTIGLPNLLFDYHLSNGFPLITTREINFTGMAGELRAFLLGCTKNEEFRALGCNFWSKWKDKLFHRDPAKYKKGDLGPIYGAQWNKHGQLNHVLDSLLDSPEDRRMVVSAWRPDEHYKMSLPPCHILWVATTYDDELNLSWHQRSADFPIGVPYNIASYALLTHLLAKWAGLKPGWLSAVFCDAHIYENQLTGVKQQLRRLPVSPPPQVEVELPGTRNFSDFHEWKVELKNYTPHPKIDFGEVEV